MAVDAVHVVRFQQRTQRVGQGVASRSGSSGGGDICDVVPALALPDPNDPNATSAKNSQWKMLETSGFTRRGASDGWSSKASDVRTWRSVLKTAYDGEEGEGEK